VKNNLTSTFKKGNDGFTPDFYEKVAEIIDEVRYRFEKEKVFHSGYDSEIIELGKQRTTLEVFLNYYVTSIVLVRQKVEDGIAITDIDWDAFGRGFW
jgi:hypothetical protein